MSVTIEEKMSKNNNNLFKNVRSKIDCRWQFGTPLVRRQISTSQAPRQQQQQQQRRRELFRNDRRSNSADPIAVPVQWIDYRNVQAQRQLDQLRQPNFPQERDVEEEIAAFLRAALTTIGKFKFVLSYFH